MHTPDFLRVANLTKEYRSKTAPVKALNNVSLDIKEGEIFGLLGVNGAGKTTLSSILATLHPATSGDVLFKGASIYNNIAAYRRQLGFCPQYQNLDAELSVRNNLIFAGRYMLLSAEESQNRTNELLKQFELERYADFKIDELSGGTKQRVLIARALIHKPALIILDEPTVGLDPDIRRTLWAIIKDLKKSGITIILTTHYLDEAEVLSDRICILHKGTVRLIESVQALKQKHAMANLEEIFIRLTKEYQQEAVL